MHQICIYLSDTERMVIHKEGGSQLERKVPGVGWRGVVPKEVRMRRFEVYFKGMFYSFALLDEKGKEQYTLTDAAALAERMYGEDWREVCNGQEGIAREDWLN